MIVEQQFLTTAVVVKKGFLNKEEAEKLSYKWNSESDVYTSYTVQMYQDESTLDLNGKIKLI